MEANHEPMCSLRPPETWLDRLKQEHQGLVEKLTKLDAFLDGTGGRALPPAEYGDLRFQRFAMKEYRDCLERRLHRASL